MRKWAIAIAVLAALGIFAWWFWSLGSVPSPQQATITLEVTADPVSIKRFGASEWTAVNGNAQISQGDAVKTGAGGAATVIFAGRAESRLASNSELTLDQTTVDPNAPFSTLLHLTVGRVWSRVLRLLDLDESFAVRTDAVVATVRGTSFDLQTAPTGTTLWVSDSAVEVAGDGQRDVSKPMQTPLVLNEGYSANFDPQGSVVHTQQITDAAKQSAWFRGNTANDQAFDQKAAADLQNRLNALGGTRPGSLADGFSQASERLHLLLAGADASKLYGTYAERRMAVIMQMVASGSSGQAFQALSSLEEEMNGRITRTDGAAYRQSIRMAIGDVLFLLKDVEPSSPLYRMKQRLEDDEISMASGAVETAYAHLLGIEARLEEASVMIGTGSVDDAGSALDAAQQGLMNVERDIDQLPDSAPVDRVRALRSKLDVLKAREATLRIRLATAVQPPTSEIQGAATSTVMVATSTLEILSPTSTASFTGLRVAASPNPANVGQTVTLKCIGILADGSTTDVTAKTQFLLQGTVGQLNGPTYVSDAAGNVTIAASYTTSDGQTLHATVNVQIKAAPVTLTGMNVTTVDGSTSASLLSGERVQVMATAVYSDGTQKDVTPFVQFVSSDPQIGSFAGNVFLAGQTAGTATVTGRYTESGVVVSGNMPIAVAIPLTLPQ